METSQMNETLQPTILIVEDEALLRLVAVETFQDAGYKVLEASNGDVGLSVLKSDAKIDLLITDVKMPGLSGYQLAEAGLDLRPEMKVVLMTGYASEAIPAALRSASIRILYKPFNFDELSSLVEKIIEPTSGNM